MADSVQQVWKHVHKAWTARYFCETFFGTLDKALAPSIPPQAGTQEQEDTNQDRQAQHTRTHTHTYIYICITKDRTKTMKQQQTSTKTQKKTHIQTVYTNKQHQKPLCQNHTPPSKQQCCPVAVLSPPKKNTATLTNSTRNPCVKVIHSYTPSKLKGGVLLLSPKNRSLHGNP